MVMTKLLERDTSNGAINRLSGNSHELADDSDSTLGPTPYIAPGSALDHPPGDRENHACQRRA